MRLLIALMMMLLLTGCFGPVQPTAVHHYMLDSIPTNLPPKTPHEGTLLIMTPSTRPVFNTTSMLYSDEPYQVSSFVVNDWAKTPSEMLHSLMLETLMNAHYFKHVVSPPYGGHYDYLLNTRILTLQQDYSTSTPVVKLSMAVQLIKSETQNIIASTIITIDEPITDKTPYGGVVAANKAVNELLSQLAVFTYEKL